MSQMSSRSRYRKTDSIRTTVARLHAKPAAINDSLIETCDRADAYPDPAVWIHRLSRHQVLAQATRAIERLNAGNAQPLLGVPFAVKDNIDVAGVPTTAACPAFSYTPTESATAVQRLCEAGAIVIGKTNLDQFATGLSGTRSPYGICRNVFDERYLSGGSSAGSAVAVAAGLVLFALGTDTAGSGRVPAGFNNIVGLKPTRGLISTAGVVPACRSLDCVSVFAHTCDDARIVFDMLQAHDDRDPYSRELPSAVARNVTNFRFGVPSESFLQFFGNTAAAKQFQTAVERCVALGGSPVSIDLTPFIACADLLYNGPWIAERLVAIRPFMEKFADSMLPVTRSIIERGASFDAASAFEGQYELKRLTALAAKQWERMDVLLVPTTGTIYTVDEMLADPIRLNSNLGYYTNFVNLMDLCAVAVPSGFQPDGLPTGVTFIARTGEDRFVIAVADSFHKALLSDK